jgi:5-methylcytosine-specific restriction protein A
MCVQCGTRASAEVHHKLPLRTYPHLKYVLDNLEALCKPCHQARTAKEQQNQGGGARFV